MGDRKPQVVTFSVCGLHVFIHFNRGIICLSWVSRNFVLRISVERGVSEEAVLDIQVGNKDPNRIRDWSHNTGDGKKGMSILEKMDELKWR